MMRHRLLYTLSGWISLLFLYTSCSNEVEFPDSKDELVTVRLTATINSKEFSTDNEIVPMRTRTNSIADYNVTAINDSRLIIIKEVDNSTWVIEEIEDKVIPQGYIKSPIHLTILSKRRYAREIINLYFSLMVRKTIHYNLIKALQKAIFHG